MELRQRMLEMLGYRVLAAGTPGAALRQAQDYTGKIDLPLANAIMPEMNGRQLSERLREFRPGSKRLFMLGYTASIIAHHGVLDTRENFLHKPFSKQTLAAKVRQVLALHDE